MRIVLCKLLESYYFRIFTSHVFAMKQCLLLYPSLFILHSFFSSHLSYTYFPHLTHTSPRPPNAPHPPPPTSPTPTPLLVILLLLLHILLLLRILLPCENINSVPGSRLPERLPSGGARRASIDGVAFNASGSAGGTPGGFNILKVFYSRAGHLIFAVVTNSSFCCRCSSIQSYSSSSMFSSLHPSVDTAGPLTDTTTLQQVRFNFA